MIFRYNPNGQEAVVPLESRNASGYILAFDNTAEPPPASRSTASPRKP